MPTIAPPAKVLVTGANGYVACWVVRTLLEGGYAVRGTVRSAEKAQQVKDIFVRYKEEGRLEIVVVEDITVDGAFDEAVKGVDAIVHSATNVTLEADDPDEVIIPAVNGTLGILTSALAHGTTLKRIVLTSSTAAIMSPLPSPHTFTEADWDDHAVATVAAHGRAAPGAVKYRAGKTLAEKAAWRFVREQQAEIGWDLAVLHPPWILGPPIHPVGAPAALNASLRTFYDTVLRPAGEDALMVSGAWVDVRDLAAAHVRALEVEGAGGERMIVSAGAYYWQDWLDIANALTPAPLGTFVFPKGNPGAGAGREPALRYDARKAGRILGVRYRTREECCRDMLEDFRGRGWVAG